VYTLTSRNCASTNKYNIIGFLKAVAPGLDPGQITVLCFRKGDWTLPDASGGKKQDGIRDRLPIIQSDVSIILFSGYRGHFCIYNLLISSLEFVREVHEVLVLEVAFGRHQYAKRSRKTVEIRAWSDEDKFRRRVWAQLGGEVIECKNSCNPASNDND